MKGQDVAEVADAVPADWENALQGEGADGLWLGIQGHLAARGGGEAQSGEFFHSGMLLIYSAPKPTEKNSMQYQGSRSEMHMQHAQRTEEGV